MLAKKGPTPLLWDLRMHIVVFLRPKVVSLAEERSTVMDKTCFSHKQFYSQIDIYNICLFKALVIQEVLPLLVWFDQRRSTQWS